MPSTNDAVQERRRRTIEFGYRVCGLVEGVLDDGRPRICVMPRGHQTSPHRDADGADFLVDAGGNIVASEGTSRVHSVFRVDT